MSIKDGGPFHPCEVMWRADGIFIQHPFAANMTVPQMFEGAIRQQALDIAELEVFAEIGRQWNADSSLAKWFPLTAERVDQDAQEIAKLRTDLAAAVAERDSYRDEFSGLCHALSVGSEGRPEMTAADWRKRVDDGVEFLLRPLIAQRDELVAAYEFARHVVRDDPGITPRGALIRQSDEIGRLRARLAAIAELEKTAAEPVAWMWNDEIGVPHASAGSKKPVWLESSASAEYIKQANLRPLYAAPPAPVAEIREPTREMVRRVAADFYGSEYTGADSVREVLKLWQRELGPTLGLVKLKEPTPEECERICTEYERLLMREGTCGGRDAFDAVRNVMWPKEGA